MSTPNQFPLEKKGSSPANQPASRTTGRCREGRFHQQKSTHLAQFQAQIRDARSTLPDYKLATRQQLPSIILLSNAGEVMSRLRTALEQHSLQVESLSTCQEAARKLAELRLPVALFTDLYLPDGDWQEVLQIAREAPVPVRVIAVSRIVDVRLYLDTLDAGAFDFVVPPFTTPDLDYIIVNALQTRSEYRPPLNNAISKTAGNPAMDQADCLSGKRKVS